MNLIFIYQMKRQISMRTRSMSKIQIPNHYSNIKFNHNHNNFRKPKLYNNKKSFYGNRNKQHLNQQRRFIDSPNRMLKKSNTINNAHNKLFYSPTPKPTGYFRKNCRVLYRPVEDSKIN